MAPGFLPASNCRADSTHWARSIRFWRVRRWVQGDKVIDLVDQSFQKRLVLGLEIERESREGDVAGLSNRNSCLANEFLALITNCGQLRDLLLDIDIDVQKAGRILMDDTGLLAIEEME
jgi:hypothetical protein